MPESWNDSVDSTRGFTPTAVRPPPRGLRVTVLRGADAGTTVALPNTVVVVGRSAVADVRLTDPMVSAFHVELTTAPDGIVVNDLHSRNGSFYAGARLRVAVVPSEATLQLGETLLRVELDAECPRLSLAPKSFGELRGVSTSMREVFHTLERLARTDLSILVEGPTGTGKELAARALHAASDRASGPFVVLDCTAIPPTLAESVLFGHERGAFTGANEARSGVFETANGGTVFLDEVGELPLELQPKLLRVLERREVVRVGGRDVRSVRFRVVCATWRDLRAMINTARFREDLYYRLADARVTIPALRDRPDDIATLVAHFLDSRPRDAPGARGIAPDALREIGEGEYPGNVRELRSVVERAAATAAGAVITSADLAFARMLTGERRRAADEAFDTDPAPAPTPAPSPVRSDRASLAATGDPLVPFKDAKRDVIDEFERNYLERLLERAGGRLTRAARLAGLERHTMRTLFRKYGLETVRGGDEG